MGPNIYLYHKALEAHYQDLLREAEKQRLLAQLPRHRRSTIKRAAGKLGVLMLKLGTRLKQFEQSPTLIEDHP
jgi:lipid II:glycine glycyltransferase (peptidoglycan interpeptide bridge formation enzyme)